MTLTEKAQQFITCGNPAGQYPILSDCLKAGTLDALNATQIMSEDMYDGDTFNYLLKAPAAFCLARWGEKGLEALIEAANRTPSTKNRSLAIEVLATLSAGERLPQATTWIKDEEVASQLYDSIEDWNSLSRTAQQLLGKYVMSFEDQEDLLMTLSSQLSKRVDASPAFTRTIIAAMARQWLAVSIPVILKYESLLREHPDDEPRIQEFLERHPQLIDPMAFEVWPRPRIHGAKEPDFLIRRTDDSFLVVEIETPGKSLITSLNKLSAEATHAVSQVVDYADFLSERNASIRQHIPSFRRPEGLVVVGIEAELNQDQKRALVLENQSRHQVRTVGFDWLAQRAQSIVQNVIEQDVRVRSGLRIV